MNQDETATVDRHIEAALQSMHSAQLAAVPTWEEADTLDPEILLERNLLFQELEEAERVLFSASQRIMRLLGQNASWEKPGT